MILNQQGRYMKLKLDLNNNIPKNAIVGVILLWLTVVVTFVLLGPLITIWALNTLFHTEIPFNSSTWVAVFWLMVLLKGVTSSKNDE